MTRDTYLSIDLDYWNKADFDPALLDHAFDSGLPLHITLDHHDLLPHADRFPHLTRLVNIDYHSDLMSAHEPLHIGNWVNYVSWRAHADYLWIVPRLNDYHLKWGYCHVGENPFLDTRRLTGWKAADKAEGYDLLNLTTTAAAIGICISPNYLDHGTASTAALRHLIHRTKESLSPVLLSRNEENNVKFHRRLDELKMTAPRLSPDANLP